MTKNEFRDLTAIKSPDVTVIRVDSLSNTNDRTLIYGYTFDGYFFHLYIQSQTFYKLVYQKDGQLVDYSSSTAMAIDEVISIKTGLPEKCDYEFCMRIRECGKTMRFNHYDDSYNSKEKFHGKLLEEVKPVEYN